MKHVTLLGLATAALPASALADADNGWTYGYGSMMGGGWGGGFFGGKPRSGCGSNWPGRSDFFLVNM